MSDFDLREVLKLCRNSASKLDRYQFHNEIKGGVI